jgi:hypothetical protein
MTTETKVCTSGRMGEVGSRAATSDVFVLGCARSGTSAIAGLLSNASYFMGEDLLAPNELNPGGYFQDRSVISINEELLDSVAPRTSAGTPSDYGWDRPRRGQRWLLRLPLHVRLSANEQQDSMMASLTRRKPFCLKDPRFVYTLPCWLKHATAPRVICVFRHPAEFVRSVFRLCLLSNDYHDFAVSVGQLFSVWHHAYRFVLASYPVGEWHFIEFSAPLDARALAGLGEYVGRELDRNTIRTEWQTAQRDIPLPAPVARMYRELQGRAIASRRSG